MTFTRGAKSGRLIFVHHLKAVEYFDPNCSTNQLLAFYFSTSQQTQPKVYLFAVPLLPFYIIPAKIRVSFGYQ